MRISVDTVKAGERAAFASLMKMYCYEWSQYNLFDVDQDGVFPFERHVDAILENPRSFCSFARVDGILAGFAIVDDDFVLRKDSDFSVGEFFVMHKYRRAGVGSHLAKTLFDRHRGKWEVGFHPRNTASESFWLHTVSAYTAGRYALTREVPALRYHDGSLGSVLAFDNGTAGESQCCTNE